MTCDDKTKVKIFYGYYRFTLTHIIWEPNLDLATSPVMQWHHNKVSDPEFKTFKALDY